jgi:uncharacterized protein involved in type VI secretion and phage assembly
MASLIDELISERRPAEQRIYGVAIGEVIDNIDLTQAARVQLRLPWLPGYEPWARVAAMSAGSSRGAFFIPQVGDEVLVAFNHGDVREPYVVGSLWNGEDSPPASSPTDAISKRLIKTPAGHQIELDDFEQSIEVKTSTGQKVKLAADSIELSTTGGTAKVTLGTAGRIELTATLELVIKAPSISIQGTSVDVKADGSASLNGGGACAIKGGVVTIN